MQTGRPKGLCHAPDYIDTLYHVITQPFRRRKFRDFARKQVFHGIDFAICVDILALCFDIFRIFG